MFSAFIGLIGVLIGALISFFSDYKKHKWKKEERIQEIFIYEKMKIYKQLSLLLNELVYKVDINQLGEEILRFPKDKRISPEYCSQELDDNKKNQLKISEEIYEKIESIKSFVKMNSFYLSKEVMKKFWSNFYRFLSWRNKINHKTDTQLVRDFPNFFDDFNESKNNLLYKTIEAMYEELGEKSDNFVSKEELEEIKKFSLVKKV